MTPEERQSIFPEWDERSKQRADASLADALDRVDKNAPDYWKQAVDQAIAVVAKARPEFTTDAVHGLLAHWHIPDPHEPRAMGPAMKRSVKAGICRPTGRYVPSVRAECNRRPVIVYQSLICGQRPSRVAA